MRYLPAFTHPFKGPHWGMNLLFGAIAQLVPIVGPITCMGYGADVIATLVNQPEASFPKFDTSLITRYFKRGVWPFLCTLVAILVLLPVVAASFLPALAIPLLDLRDGWIAVPIILCVLTCLLMMVLFGLLLQPIFLRAVLMQEFAASFSPGPVLGFIKRMWLTMLGVQLLFILVFVLLTPLFFCLAFTIVGTYFFAAYITMAGWSLTARYYLAYLDRGGSPFPIKDPPPPQLYGDPGPAFPVQPVPPPRL